MSKATQGKIAVAIDVGTTKICVIVAQIMEQNITILGLGKTASDGLEKGVVVDIARTVKSIKQAVQEAELMADVTIESAYVGISGSHIHSFNSHGVVPIKRTKVTAQDVANVMDAARAVPIAQGAQILHTLAQYFVIDSRERVNDPQGMHGTRLEVEAHIIVGAIASVQNLIKCCELAGVRVTDVVLEQLASADAVLSRDERYLGCGVIDIGGGTSDFALYKDGSIRHSFVLPVAGNHVTRDIALGMHTTVCDAERIKKEYGIASSMLVNEDVPFEIKTIQGDSLQVALLSELTAIIEPRVHELLSLIHQNLVKHKLMVYMNGGLVITGGGSLLRGIDTLAHSIFGVPVRIGYPSSSYDVPSTLKNPMYATGYGLLVHACKEEYNPLSTLYASTWSARLTHRMRSWISDFF